MDNLSKNDRSKLMGKIRHKNTKPEILLRKGLYKIGKRYRIHTSSLPGRPDVVFPKKKVAIFVNGCFWHGHENCIDGRTPKTNSLFWEEKFKKNKERDQRNYESLSQMGWQVLIFWECQVERELPQVINEICMRLGTEIM
jgi:DNA mismatch endonuclease, patch repair protein